MYPLSPRTSHWNPTLCQVALIAVRSQLCWTAWPKTTIRWQLGYSSKCGWQLPCLNLIPNAALQQSSLLMSFSRSGDDIHSIRVHFTYSDERIAWVSDARDGCCTDSIWGAWFISLGKQCTSDTADQSRIHFQISILQSQSAQLSPFQVFLSIKCLLFLRICTLCPSHIFSDGLRRPCVSVRKWVVVAANRAACNRGCMSALFRHAQCRKTPWVLGKLIYE